MTDTPKPALKPGAANPQTANPQPITVTPRSTGRAVNPQTAAPPEPPRPYGVEEAGLDITPMEPAAPADDDSEDMP